MINCIAIDDDARSLENLRDYIIKSDGLKLIQSYSDPIVALLEITDGEPVDIIFMDIEMPNISGIELAPLIRSKTRHLIFTTSYTKYALDAFELSASAYLLKPYTYSSFATTLERILKIDSEEQSQLMTKEKFFYLSIGSGEKLRIVRIVKNNLVAISGDKKNIYIHSSVGSIRYKSLRTKSDVTMISKQLGFIQTSDFSVIAKAHISQIKGFTIFLTNGLTFKVDPVYQNDFQNFISKNLLRKKIKGKSIDNLGS